MTTSIILAKIMGLYLTIISIAMFYNAKSFAERIQGFREDSPLMLFVTIVSLIVGLIIIVFHNVWVWDWRVIITLLGWITVVRSIIYLFCPSVISKFIGLFESTTAVYIAGGVALVLGLILDYYGFIALL